FESLSMEKVWSITLDKTLHGSSAHLWYFYMIIGVYLAIPFLRKILIHSTNREIEIFLLLCLFSMLFTSKSLYKVMPKFDLTFFSGYIGYLVLGYYLSIKEFKFKRSVLLLAFTYLLMVIVGAIGTYLLNQHVNKLNTFFYNYLFATTAIAAGALFLWVKESMWNMKVPTW